MGSREDLDNFQVFVTVALYVIGVLTIILSLGYRAWTGVPAGFSLMICSYLYEQVSMFLKDPDGGGS